MMWIRNKLAALFQDERGQTAVEYMLIIAVIVGVIFTLGKTFREKFTGLVNQVFTQIDRKVKQL